MPDSKRTLTHLVDEAGFSDIREATDEKCARVWVDGWKTSQMLTSDFQILQRGGLTLHDGGHSRHKKTVVVQYSPLVF